MRIGALAWLGVAALATAALAGAGGRKALAEGAIAVGSTGNVKRDGIAFGMASDEPPGTAGDLAVKRCRTFEAKAAAARCEVVVTFSGECFAIAYDPQPGTPGAGWGVGPDQLIANQKAVAMCEQAAGPGRKGYCQVERFGCDSGPKLPPKADADAPKDAVPQAPTPEAKPEAPADAKPTPGTEKKDKTPGEDAKAGTDRKKSQDVKLNAIAEPSPPPAPQLSPGGQAKRQTPADRSEPKGRGAGSVLLPVMALAGVGIAYAVGQHLRGSMQGGASERQIITGGALAVAAAIAVKLLDMLGTDPTTTAAVAALIALGAAFLA